MEITSPRMERVLQVLIENAAPSTKEIEDKANVAAARDWIRRLRDKGFKIETIEEGYNESGARIVRYRLHRKDFDVVRDTLFPSPGLGSRGDVL